MALDQIWKQQLTLVTYGNEYLQQNLGFQSWLNHAIFNQHCFYFRDLLSQHLLAQHFQIWLEGLKKQGCQRISLHRSTLLNEEHNPNPNIELLAFPHFIVSHHEKNKYAWILGKELAEWYSADNDYEAPQSQTSPVRQEVFWRYDLNPKLFKRIQTDLDSPNWDDIQDYMDKELFNHSAAQGFTEPPVLDQPYSGLQYPLSETDIHQQQAQSLLPTNYSADYAHRTLTRLEALSYFVEHQIHQSSANHDHVQLLNHFNQKLDDLYAKFIVKAANHYQNAQLTPITLHNPLDDQTPLSTTTHKKKFKDPQISSKSGAFTLIIITIIICIIGYYFGL
ncbi:MULTISPECIES: hypothetical protein [unclassified Acinetobacter]|uniref:hypothetical protein n=1 Tax=unclassified Acinetobacter TaxID=196816 RepID=UPI002934C004|nr:MULTISPECIES: hypothetical protein [unclassified Acinetobacter]WOE30399.1 hypothetical protein QSG84_08225 [Acinetobacter sp. SAAs470]WOE38590.1 hypothetical protein QSG86_01890 [Acinetobacter sp. SAAs474]